MKQSKRVKGIICKAILATVILLLLTIGVPISINEVYKYGSLYGGYATEWGAADVLSYYGTILGSAIAVSSLVITIWFTRKQIIRDSYLKSEDEKWSKIETVLADALNDINPMRLLIETMDTGFNNPSATITTIQKYQMSCKVATDQLHTCLSTTDFPKVKNLIDAINTFTERISEICTEQISAYSKLRNYLSLDTAKKTMEMESQYPGSFPPETLSFCSRIINETNGLNSEDIQDAIGKLTMKMVEAHQSTYRKLLQLKGSTFAAIDAEIQNKADNMLHLRRKS